MRLTTEPREAEGKDNKQLVLTDIRKICVFLCITAVVGISSACGAAGDTVEGAADSDSEAVLSIENDSAAETEPVISMNLDGGLLPVLEGVTTAEDNSVLAPAYLRVGEQHKTVLQLQSRLMSLGYMDNDEPTTYYGEATAESIRKFQRQQGMTQDGVCGIETWDKLFAGDAPYYKVKNGDDGQDIVQIQQRLYQLGYLMDDSATGHFGDATEAAVKKMQERNGLTVDGEAGKDTINLLYSDEVKANLIGLGEQSDLVKHFQERLIALGYLREEADGNFGGATERAVREFQSRNDQVVDGYLGPDTRLVLDSSDAKPFGLRVGDSSASVTTVQKRLNHYGYLASRLITGYYGSATEAAVKQFQRYNNLTQDGKVGQATMAKLESSNAVKKPAEVAQSSAGASNSAASSSSGSSAGSASSGASTAGVGAGGATVSGSAGNLIAIASSKLGCPYVWGSKGPNSFDCSGFVYWCLNQAGVGQSYLTSSGWRNPGRYQRISSIDQVQAGDIIVVSGHVGICAGGGTVIDASSSNGRVVHRSISNWWRNNFIVAWRIFA